MMIIVNYTSCLHPTENHGNCSFIKKNHWSVFSRGIFKVIDPEGQSVFTWWQLVWTDNQWVGDQSSIAWCALRSVETEPTRRWLVPSVLHVSLHSVRFSETRMYFILKWRFDEVKQEVLLLTLYFLFCSVKLCFVVLVVCLTTKSDFIRMFYLNVCVFK